MMDMDEIFEEIAEYIKFNHRQPGDIDGKQLGDKYGRSKRWGTAKMKEIAEQDERYITLKIFDPESSHYINVLRRITD